MIKVSIDVEIIDTGNPRRGYHDHQAIVQFNYEGSSRYTAEKERTIVDAIIGPESNWMWHKIDKPADHIYKLRYGYDSGD